MPTINFQSYFSSQDLLKCGSKLEAAAKDERDSVSDSQRLESADCRSPWMRGQEVLLL